MTNFISLFPLSIVVYPGEQLNLHIFEPRYKQLITDCVANNKPFGIACVIENAVTEMGTLVKITEVTKIYDDGQMDIKTEGLQIFKILEPINEVPDKLYVGAIVSYPTNVEKNSQLLMPLILQQIRSLHAILNIEKDFKKADDNLYSYDVAHHAAMNLQEEYEFLQLLNELQRQEYLKRHLAKILPVMAEMESLKEKVKLNGHFKNLKGFDNL
jgi:uncharacterized protein